ncbi:phospholipase C, phosphocholine-specific [Luteolibacter flavescens]|uniref:peptidylprolyl isomerase n=1 Tax=Luteolibacter flavescens TaxID=1859460 RepID=A0ABT3FNG3_9BACT|nr:phospholipase C, phosphocholine-specific [Luteolibacter flavescens]MCW1884749.1 phospholipase C, phosphocholine-specific [Luteolibacter flavescens]
MISRREFLRRAALLTGGLGSVSVIPPSILRAAGIEPAEGSTYLDAEHVVILMQENRSFDHAFGTLRGVRGFDDPRAITIPGGRPVWLQTDGKGDTYAPFGLKFHESNSTWTSCLPHDRRSEVAAGNGGKHDQWLPVMQSGIDAYEHMPLTLGYYDRADLPFYHAFADAFTVCDQHFCSLQTSTTPNRLYLWTGTSRDPRDPASPALLSNGQADHDTHPDWPTFPERLEEHGISWAIYQNEIDHPTGFSPVEASWLANFGDNPMEYFAQYHVDFSSSRVAHLKSRLEVMKQQLATLIAQAGDAPEEAVTRREKVEREIAALAAEIERCSPENFANLPLREQSIHRKAFTVNRGDFSYRDLATLAYEEAGEQREVKIPAGDVLYQFRKDVDEGKLPTVSWLAAPENFSDHPSAPWYGAWYVSEVLEILTKNPEVWKKTIFILTYDENDGYYDHVPPFVPPHPDQPGSGAVSAGIDASLEFDTRGNPLGLGYRVPMVIASPWSRGGCVCSEVFDHTSVLQFLEKFLSHKKGREIRETNIGSWRRAVCGNLTSAFLPQGDGIGGHPLPVELAPFIRDVHRTRYLAPPAGYRALDEVAIREVMEEPFASPHLPRQEPGSKVSVALPYALHAEGRLDREKRAFVIRFESEASDGRGKGAPFHVYAPGLTYPDDVASYTDAPPPAEEVRRWSFATLAGASVEYAWPLEIFEGGRYFLRSYGPNGFFREYLGDAADPALEASTGYENGDFIVRLVNAGRAPLEVIVTDLSYGAPEIRKTLPPGVRETLRIDLTASRRWYDLGITVTGADHFSRRHAGRVETGKPGSTDPLIGRNGVAVIGASESRATKPDQRME